MRRPRFHPSFHRDEFGPFLLGSTVKDEAPFPPAAEFGQHSTAIREQL